MERRKNKKTRFIKTDIGTGIVMAVFSKLLKVNDALLGFVEYVCRIISTVFYGLASTSGWFYFGAVFDFLGFPISVILYSVSTLIVEHNEVGKLLALFYITEELSTVVYDEVSSSLEYDLVAAIFLIAGIMMVPVTVIFIILYILSRRHQKKVVQNPNGMETPAQENVVTTL